MTPITTVRKTLSVDLEAFAKEILRPHFHSGGPPKKVSYTATPTVTRGAKNIIGMANSEAIVRHPTVGEGQ